MLTEQIEAMWISRYDYQPGWYFNKHHHSYFQIIYIISGSGSFYYQDLEKKLAKNRLFLIAPGESHKLAAGQKNTLKTLDIKFEIKEVEFASRVKMAAGEYHDLPQIKNLLDQIWEEGRKKQDYYQELNNSFLLQILINILRVKSCSPAAENENYHSSVLKEKAKNQLCKKFINYIEENYSRDLFLKNIASELGYNQSYICQSFKENYNLTPMNFLYKYRVKKAAELLKNSGDTLTQIARKTGFKTVHHFNRTFSKYQGKPPGEYRDEYLLAVRKDIYLTADFVNKDRLQKQK
ncbi:AraC family transcriptional regulator [Halanaerobium saccharolyticum]|uniref:AraC family transcriptional regulator n=1 Tax=Halanaerobium saccharolyticum TaxID=43595 RepID=A0A4R7YL81_9FIRM|nr:helix-turn-helix domain-containing protein [Halanaerobium saccharolyticum]RAK04982.1 AraC family transcriptional regulator [Halanaerobium saccharolyticum]TDV98336.1 AraC family transcriptional regulator [Halanaerobium saccharolyticum]TDX51334.1 AraC family transcriptional regulator [Halanaerobium saccharolyticum]